MSVLCLRFWFSSSICLTSPLSPVSVFTCEGLLVRLVSFIVVEHGQTFQIWTFARMAGGGRGVGIGSSDKAAVHLHLPWMSS